MDPEELFRTIFGDSFKKGRDFESIFENFGGGADYSQQNEIAQVKQITRTNIIQTLISKFI